RGPDRTYRSIPVARQKRYRTRIWFVRDDVEIPITIKVRERHARRTARGPTRDWCLESAVAVSEEDGNASDTRAAKGHHHIQLAVRIHVSCLDVERIIADRYRARALE